MDAEQLLRGDEPFVADTSAWWRAATLPSDLGLALQAAVIDDRFWITPIVRMEILYSARGLSEYMALETELDALRILRNDRAVTDAAMAAFREFAQHRVTTGRGSPTRTAPALPHETRHENSARTLSCGRGAPSRRRPGRPGVPGAP